MIDFFASWNLDYSFEKINICLYRIKRIVCIINLQLFLRFTEFQPIYEEEIYNFREFSNLN